MEKDRSSHVLFFPVPTQGHMNPMIKLAELLALTGFRITYLNTHHNHERLIKFTNIAAHYERYPGFEFKTITDGLPPDHPRSGHWFMEMYEEATEMKIKQGLREMLVNISPPVDCMIVDAFLGFALDVAGELGIPIVCFRTSSPCCFWTSYSIPAMIQAGELPIEDMDRLITTVPGMETIRKKLDDRGEKCIFIGYDERSKAYRLYNPLTKKLIILRDVEFDEAEYWIWSSEEKKIEGLFFNENQDDDDFINQDEQGDDQETHFRCRDLPSYCRAADMEDTFIKLVVNRTLKSVQANALILNTAEELEGPILSQIRTQCPNVYAIGPINALLKSRVDAKHGESYHHFSNTLLEENKSCISWLDKQPNRSVTYACFGSITSMSREQLIELWYGLVNSKSKFLLVVRPNSVIGKDGEEEDVVKELFDKAKDQGYIVDWAPQEAVLNHPAVGSFLTHSGWNSTLEGVVAGVPMICWPYFADQQVNSRVVSEVWKIGLEMKDVCDRKILEKMVKEVMVDRKEEFAKSAAEMAKLADQSVSVGGSSYSNLDRLIEDIKEMSLKTPQKVIVS
ncbi:ARABIDOPSIS THALIANA UDP-GLUCOSYL TRANSFERASE 85A1 [Hibiscus trionum]|uniref:ARABIDOPSIS THALIANA UDP-GLUCOSYL TRANSFERASE 85A1 n=1 Tax=Hibiscus trionum TaxID=183268 RepID=A0A9W7LXM0_HIBTR|nr:ARABIDOPSIS THALIANA UDP-GLUCOSYL TRANSFERASE 85A1 [Hibiscus trionum]